MLRRKPLITDIGLPIRAFAEPVKPSSKAPAQ